MNSPPFRLLELKVGSDIMACVKYLAVSHSSDYDFDLLPKHPIPPKIRLNLICALFRLIDGCDLLPARANRVLYEILMKFDPMDKQRQRFWKAHFSIKGVVFQKNKMTISTEDDLVSKPLTDHLIEDLDEINKILIKNGFPAFSIRIQKVK